MTEQLLKYISEELSVDTDREELLADDDLLGSGVIDSLGMIRLILFIETEFDLKVPPEDLLIENFMTVSHIVNYLRSERFQKKIH